MSRANPGWPRQAVVEKKQTRLGRGGVGDELVVVAEAAAPESEAVGSERFPFPSTGATRGGNQRPSASRWPTALRIQHKQQRGSEETALKVHARHAGPPQPARAPPPWQGRGLSANPQNHQAHPRASRSSLRRAGCAFCPLTSSTASRHSGRGLSQEAGCPEREGRCMGEVAGVHQEKGRASVLLWLRGGHVERA